jgi:uncharacterized tellurite resistance protein B-like protein
VYFLIRLCVQQPCIGIPLTIGIVVALIAMQKSRRKMQEKYIARTTAARREAAAARGAADLATLKSADTGFSEEGFKETASGAFLAVQKAWGSQDLSRVRAYISDGVRERFEIQFQMQRAMGLRNAMENVRVLDVNIAGAGADRWFHTIHSQIHAEADDTDVDAATGRKLRTNSRGGFHEYWTFLRKPGAVTPEKGGLVEGFCPNCGAPLEISDAGVCRHCGAHVTSGAFDWILTEITQESVWTQPASPSAIPGFDEMAARDPGFSLAPLEDAASVVFWRYVKSYFDGEPAAMGKVALREFLDSFTGTLRQTREDDWHLYFHDPAVGSVDVLDVTPGDDYDRVRVLVKWSAWNRWRTGDGRTRGSGDRSIRPQVFTLVRKPGVLTRTGGDFHSAHCPGCGAPYTGEEQGNCEYCGRSLNDGSGNWVLEDISAFRAGTAAIAPAAGAGADPELILSAMVATMFADGVPDERERRLLESFAASRGIRQDRLAGILAAAGQGQGPPAVSGTAEARALLGEMVETALADGAISREETAFLQSFCSGAGLSQADLRLAISSRRRKLYREARKNPAGG